MAAPLLILLVFACLVALYGAYKTGEAREVLREARRFDAQGRKRLPL